MDPRCALRSGALLLVAAIVPACNFDGTFTPPFPVTTLNAVLSGSQVVPSVATAAGGTATLRIDDAQNKIEFGVSASGLGTVTGVRIHFGDPGINGPMMFSLAGGPFTNPLTGTLTYVDLLPNSGATTFHAATSAILTGKAYVLITTVANPAGEIRGQIGPVLVAAARLSGPQVDTPVATAAAGSATLQLNAAQDRITVTLTFTGIPTAASAHVHAGAIGVAGPAIFNLSTVAFSSPLTVTLAPLDFTAGGGLTTFAEAVNALLSGQLYVDVETLANPAGEIRSQAGPARLTAALSAASVVPVNSSTATGTASLVFNATQTGVTLLLTHSVGTPTGVLIHADVVGSNGPLIFNVGTAAGSSSSPLEVFLDAPLLVPQASKAVNTFAEAVDALLSELTYIDISSTGFLSGEIRGQIVP